MRRMDKSRSVSHLAGGGGGVASPSMRQLSQQHQQRNNLPGTPTKASDSMLGRVGRKPASY